MMSYKCMIVNFPCMHYLVIRFCHMFINEHEDFEVHVVL